MISYLVSMSQVAPPYPNTYGAGTLDVSAVPEPETYALMLVGLGLVGFAARRRSN
jgi:hypothetical protein